jgi:hypothetical protein
MRKVEASVPRLQTKMVEITVSVADGTVYSVVSVVAAGAD